MLEQGDKKTIQLLRCIMLVLDVNFDVNFDVTFCTIRAQELLVEYKQIRNTGNKVSHNLVEFHAFSSCNEVVCRTLHCESDIMRKIKK